MKADIQEFLIHILSSPSLVMVWGDVGVGKSTIALQLAYYILSNSTRKVFYLTTKSTPISGIIQRIFHDLSTDQQEQFFFWGTDSYRGQYEIIGRWILQIQQLKQWFQENQVGIIVLDELMSLYLHEIGSDEKNDLLNRQLTAMMGILGQISLEHRIPVIVLNSFSVKLDEKTEEYTPIPYGGKIIDYWIDVSIKIERTNQISRMQFNLEKNRKELALPNLWVWRLGDHGFENDQ